MTDHSNSGFFRLALLQSLAAVSVLALASLVPLLADAEPGAPSNSTPAPAPFVKWTSTPVPVAVKADKGVFTPGVNYGLPADQVVYKADTVLTRIDNAHRSARLGAPATVVTR